MFWQSGVRNIPAGCMRRKTLTHLKALSGHAVALAPGRLISTADERRRSRSRSTSAPGGSGVAERGRGE